MRTIDLELAFSIAGQLKRELEAAKRAAIRELRRDISHNARRLAEDIVKAAQEHGDDDYVINGLTTEIEKFGLLSLLT